MTNEKRNELLEAIEKLGQSGNTSPEQRKKLQLALAAVGATSGDVAPVTLTQIKQKMKSALADGEACMVDC